MKIKTSELVGPALQYAVAQASGQLDSWIRDPAHPGTSIKEIGFDDDDVLMVYVPGDKRNYIEWQPDINWSQGGPIIERERIGALWNDPQYDDEMLWIAYFKCGPNTCTVKDKYAYGPTPLIAAMRCFVESRLGSEVEIPEALLR